MEEGPYLVFKRKKTVNGHWEKLFLSDAPLNLLIRSFRYLKPKMVRKELALGSRFISFVHESQKEMQKDCDSEYFASDWLCGLWK